jgi:hypothetical protein
VLQPNEWSLESAEERARAHPETYELPSHDVRTSLVPGDGGQLLFVLVDEDDGGVVEQVERMWVVVDHATEDRYAGILDSTPLSARAAVERGSVVDFGPEHVSDVTVGEPGVAYLAQLRAHFDGTNAEPA